MHETLPTDKTLTEAPTPTVLQGVAHRLQPRRAPIANDSDSEDEEEMADLPPRNKCKIREISIKALDRGFVVKVGCQSLALLSTAELLTNLAAYLRDPDAVERLWQNSGQLPSEDPA